MANMERADDFVIFIHAMDVGSAAVAARFAIPRAARLVKSYAMKHGAYAAAPVLTVASSKGNLTDTHVIPTAGADEDVSEKDFREEANNSFAAGTKGKITVGTPSAGDFASVTLVFRPL